MEIGSLVSESVLFLKSHPELSCFLLFTWAFLETGLLLGLLLPAEKVLIVGSVLVAKGALSPFSYVLCVSAGTSLGYTATYFFGFFLGEELLSKVLKRFGVKRETFLKVKSFVERKGELSLIVGRFFAVVRALLPLVIGAFEPSFLRFTIFNVVGALIWATAYLFLGDLIERSFSIIITHKLETALVIALSLILYALWRKHGKDKKNLSGT